MSVTKAELGCPWCDGREQLVIECGDVNDIENWEVKCDGCGAIGAGKLTRVEGVHAWTRLVSRLEDDQDDRMVL